MGRVGKINPPTADKNLASNALVDEKKCKKFTKIYKNLQKFKKISKNCKKLMRFGS
jgi:hypothetical protein